MRLVVSYFSLIYIILLKHEIEKLKKTHPDKDLRTHLKLILYLDYCNIDFQT